MTPQVGANTNILLGHSLIHDEQKGDFAAARKTAETAIASAGDAGWRGSANISQAEADHADRNGKAFRLTRRAGRFLGRTFVKLAFQGGAKLNQIQLSLGHASIQTTERYLGVEQDLTDAPRDYLHLKVE